LGRKPEETFFALKCITLTVTYSQEIEGLCLNKGSEYCGEIVKLERIYLDRNNRESERGDI